MKATAKRQPAADLSGQERHVNIRGYVRKVKVSHRTPSGEWAVMTANHLTEIVPEHLFYHSTPGGLILRDGLEFKRLYPNHPIDIDNCPSI